MYNDRNEDFISLLSSLPVSSLRTYNMDITYIILCTLCSARVFPFFFQLNGDSNADSVAAVVSSACYAFTSLETWQCIYQFPGNNKKNNNNTKGEKDTRNFIEEVSESSRDSSGHVRTL